MELYCGFLICPHGVLLNKCRDKNVIFPTLVGTMSCEVSGFIKRSTSLVFYLIVLEYTAVNDG